MKRIRIDPALLGPRASRVGDTFTAFYGRYAVEYRWDGAAWVKHRETDHNGQWPADQSSSR